MTKYAILTIVSLLAVLPMDTSAQDSRAEAALAATQGLITSEFADAFDGRRVGVALDALAGDERVTVANALGMEQRDVSASRRCDRPQGLGARCELVGIDFLVIVKEGWATDARGNFLIEVQGEAPGDRKRVWHAGYEVGVLRTGDGWRVVEIKDLYQVN